MIPFGQIYAYFLGIGSLKTKGSGNIGATNAYRVGGKALGIATLISDMAKGFLCVYFFPHPWVFSFVTLGHIQFPFFTGGKGVATALGAAFALNIWLGFSLLALWLSTFSIARISGVASMITFLSFPIVGYFFNVDLIMSGFTSLVILYAHRKNFLACIHNPATA